MHAPSRSSRSAVHAAALGPPLARPPKLPLHVRLGAACRGLLLCAERAVRLAGRGGRELLGRQEAQREGELHRGHQVDLQTVLLDPAGVHEDSGVVQAQPVELGHELFAEGAEVERRLLRSARHRHVTVAVEVDA